MAAVNKFVFPVLIFAEIISPAKSEGTEPVCIKSDSHPGVFLATDCQLRQCTTTTPAKGFNCSIWGYEEAEQVACKNSGKHLKLYQKQTPTVDQVCQPLLTSIGQYLYSCPELHTTEKAIDVGFQLPICDAESARTSQRIRVVFSASTKRSDNFYARNPVCRVYDYDSSSLQWTDSRTLIEVTDRCLGIGLQTVWPEVYYYLSFEEFSSGTQVNYTIKFMDVNNDSLQLLAGAWLSRGRAHIVFKPIEGISKYRIDAKSEVKAWSYSKEIDLPKVTIRHIPDSSNIVTVTVSPVDLAACNQLGYKCSPIKLTLIDKNVLILPADSPVTEVIPEDKMDWRHAMIIGGGVVISMILLAGFKKVFSHFWRLPENQNKDGCRTVLWISEASSLSKYLKNILQKGKLVITHGLEENSNSNELMRDNEIIMIGLEASSQVSDVMRQYLLDLFQYRPLWIKVKVIVLNEDDQQDILLSSVLQDLFPSGNHLTNQFLEILEKNKYILPQDLNKLLKDLHDEHKGKSVGYHVADSWLSLFGELESLNSECALLVDSPEFSVSTHDGQPSVQNLDGEGESEGELGIGDGELHQVLIHSPHSPNSGHVEEESDVFDLDMNSMEESAMDRECSDQVRVPPEGREENTQRKEIVEHAEDSLPHHLSQTSPIPLVDNTEQTVVKNVDTGLSSRVFDQLQESDTYTESFVPKTEEVSESEEEKESGDIEDHCCEDRDISHSFLSSLSMEAHRGSVAFCSGEELCDISGNSFSTVDETFMDEISNKDGDGDSSFDENDTNEVFEFQGCDVEKPLLRNSHNSIRPPDASSQRKDGHPVYVERRKVVEGREQEHADPGCRPSVICSPHAAETEAATSSGSRRQPMFVPKGPPRKGDLQRGSFLRPDRDDSAAAKPALKPDCGSFSDFATGGHTARIHNRESNSPLLARGPGNSSSHRGKRSGERLGDLQQRREYRGPVHISPPDFPPPVENLEHVPYAAISSVRAPPDSRQLAAANHACYPPDLCAHVVGNHVQPPPHVADNHVQPPPHVAGNHVQPPPHVAGNHVQPPPDQYAHVAGNNAQPPPHVAGNHVQPPPDQYAHVAGNHAQPPPYIAGNHVQPPPHVAGNHVQPPPEQYAHVAGNHAQPPPHVAGNHVQPPPHVAGNHVQPPPDQYAHVAGNNAQPPPHVAGNHVQPPPEQYAHVAGNHAQPPPHVAGNHAQPPPHVAGNHVKPPPHVAGNHVQPPPHVAGNHVQPPPHVAGNHAQLPPHVAGNHVQPPPHVAGNHVQPPPEQYAHVAGNHAQPPPHVAGNHAQLPPHVAGNHVQPPPHVAGNHAQLPPHVAGNHVQPPPHVAGNHVQPPPHVAGNHVQHPPHVAGNQVQPPPHVAGNHVQLPPHVAGNHVQLPPHVAGNHVQPPPHLAGNHACYPPDEFAHVAGNNAQPPPHVAGNHVQPPPHVAGNHVQPPPHVAGNHVQPPPHLAGNHACYPPDEFAHVAGNNAQPPPHVAGNHVQPPPHVAGNHVQPPPHVAGNHVQPLAHVAGNHVQPPPHVAGNHVQPPPIDFGPAVGNPVQPPAHGLGQHGPVMPQGRQGEEHEEELLEFRIDSGCYSTEF